MENTNTLAAIEVASSELQGAIRAMVRMRSMLRSSDSALGEGYEEALHELQLAQVQGGHLSDIAMVRRFRVCESAIRRDLAALAQACEHVLALRRMAMDEALPFPMRSGAERMLLELCALHSSRG